MISKFLTTGGKFEIPEERYCIMNLLFSVKHEYRIKALNNFLKSFFQCQLHHIFNMASMGKHIHRLDLCYLVLLTQ